MSAQNQTLPDVLILAAGRGRRLRPVTDATPKALLRVGGKTLLEHHLERLAELGFGSVVINLAWLGGHIRDYLAVAERRFGLEIRYSQEPADALETGGGIVNALGLLRSDPFIVLNADILCDFNYAKLEVATPLDLSLVLAPTPPYRKHGDFGLADGRLLPAAVKADDSDTSGDSPDWTYAGIGCFRRRAFDGFSAGRFPLLPVLAKAIAGGRAGGVVHRGLWLDVGTPQRLKQARQQILQP